MLDELKPCSCGSDAAERAWPKKPITKLWGIVCLNEDCGSMVESETLSEAIAAWNKRTAEPSSNH